MDGVARQNASVRINNHSLHEVLAMAMASRWIHQQIFAVLSPQKSD